MRSGPLDHLPGWARALLERERVGHLGHLDESDAPRVLPVGFALAEGAVWSAVDSKPKQAGEPARVGRLRRRPRFALCVDRYDEDWMRLAWVQLLGRVELLEPAAAAAGLAALAEKYAPYREAPPPGPVLRLEVERALCWRAGGG